LPFKTERMNDLQQDPLWIVWLTLMHPFCYKFDVKKEMNSVIIEHNAKIYQTQMAAARFWKAISFVHKSIQLQPHYNSPFHGGKEVIQHGRG